MSAVPTHRERQLLQLLRGRGWVNAVELPESRVTVERLIERRWIESQGVGRDLVYRMTEEGLEAKKAPVRLY